MASSKHSFGFGVMAIIATLIFTISFPAAVQAQTLAPAPSPTSDGSSVDQGIAYLLMLLALVLTYIIHSADISSTF
ncbi:putative arabinogalactan peptide, AGP [Medicago truncatula]|uniref:Arabinogalactan peptide-like protein n=1 Tax=Medicago truncatula TaxID=3880 RepID=I3SJE8_MEDTR|nr:arabinogalactan protein 41 [Medicago truncatula]AFK40390.1 unknown [Medicago truncatula]KEH21189.1 arabinogalactan peptide-like protein [Medicago truncatula]RHN43439.1 putative arabinogalactan peptide, AGP [Medicago truncatula]